MLLDLGITFLLVAHEAVGGPVKQKSMLLGLPWSRRASTPLRALT